MLSVLSLSNNALTGSIPTELVLLTELSVLNLSNNYLSGTVPSHRVGSLVGAFGVGSRIQHFGRHHSHRVGSLDGDLQLRLEYNTLVAGTIPTEVGLLTKLFRLDVLHNVLSVPIPSEIGLLQALYSVGINDNALSGSVPTEMGFLTTISVFGNNHGRMLLYNNDLSGTIPSSLCRSNGAKPGIDCGEIVCTCCRDGDGKSACILP